MIEISNLFYKTKMSRILKFIDAKSTEDLTILNNRFDKGSILAREHIKLKNCKNVRIN